MLVVGTRQLMSQLESRVTKVKDLGMLLDPHLMYDKHVQELQYELDQLASADEITVKLFQQLYCNQKPQRSLKSLLWPRSPWQWVLIYTHMRGHCIISII